MPDRILLESSAVDGILLENGTGVRLLETPRGTVTFGTKTDVDRDVSLILSNGDRSMFNERAEATSYRVGARLTAQPSGDKTQAEVLIVQGDQIVIGVEDGRMTFGGAGNLPHEYVQPASASGTGYRNTPGEGQLISYGVTQGRTDPPGGVLPGDVFGVRIDKLAGTVEFYHVRSNVLTVIGTTNWTSTTGNWFFFIGGFNHGAQWTLNADSTQQRPLDAGYAYYDTTVRGAWKPTYASTQVAIHFEVGPTTCFNGATPCTNDGDVCNVVRDSRTGLVLASQLVGGTLVYRTGNGKPYLEATGCDFYPAGSTKNLQDAHGQWTALAAFQPVNTGFSSVMGLGWGVGFGEVSINNLIPRVSSYSAFGESASNDNGLALSINTPAVITGVVRKETLEVYSNGVSDGTSPVNYPVMVGGGTGPSLGTASGRLYGWLVYAGLITDAEHASAVAYMQELYTPAATGPITGTASVTLAPATTTSAAKLAIVGTSTSTLSPATGIGQAALKIAAALSITLAPATSVSTGQLPIAGTSATTLAPATSTATGVLAPVGIVGTASVTLAPATSTSTGQLPIVATAAATLAPATSTSAAALALKGLASVTLTPATSVSTGQLPIAATAFSTLAPATASSAAALAITGTSTSTLAPATSTSTGQLPIVATSASTLAPATATSVGVLPITAGGSPTLAPATSTATGVLPITAGGSPTLAPATVTAAGGAPGLTGTLSVTLAPATASSTAALAIAGVTSATLAPATSTSTGQLPIVATAAATLSPATSTSSAALAIVGTAAATLSPATSTSTGQLVISAYVAATLAPATTSATGLLPIVGQGGGFLSPATLIARLVAARLFEEVIGPRAVVADASQRYVAGDILLRSTTADLVDRYTTADILAREATADPSLRDATSDPLPRWA